MTHEFIVHTIDGHFLQRYLDGERVVNLARPEGYDWFATSSFQHPSGNGSTFDVWRIVWGKK